MNIIKLDAIDSTNRYLKDVSRATSLQNFVVVHAKNQTHGKGQMGAKWISKSGKNLTMSILIKDVVKDIQQIFDLNVAVACSVLSVLQTFDIPNLSIKWPNDIMSDNKKIGGILIENLVNAQQIVAVVGIGINVNQTDFGALKQASSLLNESKIFFDIDKLVLAITENIIENIQKFSESSDFFWQQYHAVLFKKDLPTLFENIDKSRFLGMIKEVSRNGKLVVLLENDSLKSFEVKQIKMLF